MVHEGDVESGAEGRSVERRGWHVLCLEKPLRGGMKAEVTKKDREKLLADYEEAMNENARIPMTGNDGCRLRSRARLVRYWYGFTEATLAEKLHVGVRTIVRAESSTLIYKKCRALSSYADFFGIDESYFTDPKVPYYEIVKDEDNGPDPEDKKVITKVLQHLMDRYGDNR